MKKLFPIFLFIVLCKAEGQTLSYAQLDSLYNLFISVRNISSGIQSDQFQHSLELQPMKCGFELVNQIKFNLERFPPDKQELLKSFLDRPIRQTSLVSPSGIFRIHYNTTESGVPNYIPSSTTVQNVEEVGRALDSAYNFEVNYLGYLPLPNDNGAGGDDLYDVYIVDLGGSLYGYTQTETHLGQEKYTSYIVIDNDYVGYYSTGLGGMRVTVAHELHHGIQIGNYIFRSEDIYFFEITSTAMEDFVFDTVNDYYGYMDDYFNNPGRSFGANDGYNLAIWNIFIRDKFGEFDIMTGYNVLKRQWEMMPFSRALAAIHNSLLEVNSSFNEAFNEFGIWTFFTANRSIPGEFFKEAANYPYVKYTSTIPFNPASTSVKLSVKATSNNFVAFVNSSLSPDDSLIAIITNGDYVTGIDDFLTSFQFEYILAGDSLNGSTKLTDRYFVVLNVSNPVLWSVSEILNNFVLRQGGNITPPVESDEVFAYPNPFYYNKTYNSVFIVLGEGGEPEYDFNVYTSGMELVYSKNLKANNRTLRWDIKNDVGEKLSSGVYIFAVRGGDKTYLGKLVIFNE